MKLCKKFKETKVRRGISPLDMLSLFIMKLINITCCYLKLKPSLVFSLLFRFLLVLVWSARVTFRGFPGKFLNLHKSCLDPFAALRGPFMLGAVVQWLNMGGCVCMCMCVSVCVYAWLERYTKKKEEKTKKTGHPTFEWDVVFCREVPKKKNEAIFFCCERDAA